MRNYPFDKSKEWQIFISNEEIGSDGEHQFWIFFWKMTSTAINIVSIELQNSRDVLLAEVLLLKIKCNREEIHLLNHLTQPLSHNLVFVTGQGGLMSIQILWKSAVWVYWLPSRVTFLATADGDPHIEIPGAQEMATSWTSLPTNW